MSNLGDIRRATSGATRNIKDFERALVAIRNIKIRETQRVGRDLSRNIFARFAAQLFADEKGSVRPLGPFGKKWRERKKQLKLRPERGQARRGIYKQLRSPLIFAKLSDGFDIDIKRPALWVTGRARLGKIEASLIRNSRKSKNILGNVVKTLVTNRQSFYVNAYIDAYADAKAPGLGLMSTADLVSLETQVNAKIADHLRRVRGAARASLSSKAVAVLKLKFGRAA
jgi:hypothetical protein